MRERLKRLGLLKPEFEKEELAHGDDSPAALLRLCDAEALVGGLSIAIDVRPDELVGPLTTAVGGTARGLKVLEVRDTPVPTMTVRLRNEEREWRVSKLDELVHLVNKLFANDPDARAVAVLGEWEDALQLWCVDKRGLEPLLAEPFFQPLNRRELISASRQTRSAR